MKIHTGFRLALACMVCLVALVVPSNSAFGQFFDSGTTQFLDWNGRIHSQGQAGGTDAIPTLMNANTNYYHDQWSDHFYISANVQVSGMWTSSGVPQTYIQSILGQLTTVDSSIYLNRFTWNGQWYENDSPVNLFVHGDSQLLAQTDPNTPGTYESFFQMSAYGDGVRLMSSTIQVQINDHSNGGNMGQEDWDIFYSSQWIVTSDFHPLPAPGSAALLGIAALVGFRRRRR